MSLKPKQEEFYSAFRSGKYKYLCAAGTAGSGKTLGTLGLLHILCCKIPGVRFFVGRKSEKNLKQTTIPSYNEMKRKSLSSDASQLVGMTAKYRNGSEILFIWCDVTKDPELNNIRGLEVNGGLFEEANQIDKQYFEVSKTRIGRWRKELCQPFVLLNLNPSLGWVKDIFYDPWSEGRLGEGYYFLEFDEKDAKDCSGKDYVRTLQDLAPQEHDRFVKNKWDYSNVPNQLISYEWYKQCIAPEPETTMNDSIIGATDPAWEGDDSTVFGRMHNYHIGWWEEYAKQDPDVSGKIAHERIKMFHVKPRNWIVDPIGVGSATVLKLRNDLNYEPDLFISGAASTDMFGVLPCFNKRSEAIWLLGESMRMNEITFTHHPDFQKQCLAARYFIDEKKIRVIGKPDMKKLLKVSPGHLDVAMMLIHKKKTEGTGGAVEIFERQAQQNQKTQSSSRAQRDRLDAIRRNRTRE